MPFVRFTISSVLLGISCLFHAQVLGSGLNKSLIESTILINLSSLKNEDSTSAGQRRVLENNQEIAIEETVFEQNSNPVSLNEDLFEDLEDIFNNIDPSQSLEAYSYALNYLVEKKIDFSLTDEQLSTGISSVIAAFFSSFPLDDQLQELIQTTIESILPNRVAVWDSSAEKWTSLITKTIIDSIPTEYMSDASGAIMVSILSLIQNNESIPEIGFYGGIEQIENFETSNETMKFDNDLGQFMKFDPIKTKPH